MFKSPRDLQNSLQQSVRNWEKRSRLRDPAIPGQLFALDRFLTRLFSHPRGESFAVKGGMSLLARDISARGTKDIDLEVLADSLQVGEICLAEIAALELNDFYKFELVESSSIEEEGRAQPISRLKFNSKFGGNESRISVDLALVGEYEFDAEEIKPDRAPIRNLEFGNYKVMSLERQLAQKITASLQTYPSGPSSRVRDLYDIVWIAKKFQLSEAKLRKQLLFEALNRQIAHGELTPPESWRGVWLKNPSGLPREILELSFDSAQTVFAEFFSVRSTESSRIWDPLNSRWH